MKISPHEESITYTFDGIPLGKDGSVRYVWINPTLSLDGTRLPFSVVIDGKTYAVRPNGRPIAIPV